MDMEDLETLTMSELLSRQKKEFTELLAENKSLLKAKNGKARIEIEAQNLQREMDMKSHHNDQKEQLEEYLQSKGISIDDPGESTRYSDGDWNDLTESSRAGSIEDYLINNTIEIYS